MWKGKVVIITGSSMGIGRSLAIEIGKKGGKLIINARNNNRLEKTYKELMAMGLELVAYSGDISNYEDCVKIVEYAVDNFGKVDVLINNAGLTAEGTLEESSPEVFKKLMDVNFLGSVFMTKAALPYIKQTKGSILFIGSLAGIHGLGNYSAYSSSKMALTALVESLKKETYQTGIHIGIAYVGFTENDSQKTYYDKSGDIKPLPVRKIIKPKPVKEVAHQLMDMIENRRYKSAFTFVGKLNAILNRLFPALVYRILLNAYRKAK